MATAKVKEEIERLQQELERCKGLKAGLQETVRSYEKDIARLRKLQRPFTSAESKMELQKEVRHYGNWIESCKSTISSSEAAIKQHKVTMAALQGEPWMCFLLPHLPKCHTVLLCLLSFQSSFDWLLMQQTNIRSAGGNRPCVLPGQKFVKFVTGPQLDAPCCFGQLYLSGSCKLWSCLWLHALSRLNAGQKYFNSS